MGAHRRAAASTKSGMRIKTLWT
uniref:Uncharacterized protein n=1 Tax=mine drainage metagenome TaxID=410659 RepID=E6Q0Q2_9ZZZZ